jgi:hypothetical protein
MSMTVANWLTEIDDIIVIRLFVMPNAKNIMYTVHAFFLNFRNPVNIYKLTPAWRKWITTAGVPETTIPKIPAGLSESPAHMQNIPPASMKIPGLVIDLHCSDVSHHITSFLKGLED